MNNQDFPNKFKFFLNFINLLKLKHEGLNHT